MRPRQRRWQRHNHHHHDGAANLKLVSSERSVSRLDASFLSHNMSIPLLSWLHRIIGVGTALLRRKLQVTGGSLVITEDSTSQAVHGWDFSLNCHNSLWTLGANLLLSFSQFPYAVIPIFATAAAATAAAPATWPGEPPTINSGRPCHHL